MVRLLTLLLLTMGGRALAQEMPMPPPAPPDLVGLEITDLVNARNLGMGLAYMALGYGTEVIAGNPAGLTLYKRFQIEGTGSFDFAPLGGHGSIAAVDSKTSQFALGVSYTYATYGGDGPLRRHAHIGSISGAYPLSEHVHFGLTLRYFGVLGATGGPQSGHTLGINAGMIVRPIKQMMIGLAGHNLAVGTNPDIPRFATLSLGAMIAEQFSPAADVRFEIIDNQPRVAVHVGAEELIAKRVPIRLGYQGDFIRGHHYIAGGIGIFFEGDGIDLAYRHEIGGDNGRLLMLTLKLQLDDE